MYLTVITFKNGKQQFLRQKGLIDANSLKLGNINRWMDVSTGALIVFKADDVLYLSQVDEKDEQTED